MNQNPEQIARDEIDRQLLACGWVIQDKKTFNLSANIGVAIKAKELFDAMDLFNKKDNAN